VKKVTTTCPSCQTSFRVTPQQLAARQGQVRCGHCNTLFNGLETLAMTDPSKAGPATVDTSAHATDLERSVVPRTTPDRRKDAPTNIAVAERTNDADAPILYRPDFRPPAAANRKLWLAGSAFMVFLLLIQGITYFRHSLARDVPSMRPMLTTYCNMFGCELKLPRNADAITIESSDLKQFPDRPKEILLSALLRNRADYAQAFPSLELTLTDSADQAVVKRIFHPADYVEDKTAIERGIAPLQEANVRLRLELIDLAAIGYRLFVFYP
jgi:predicted Zn finger-like uncharacterized protein